MPLDLAELSHDLVGHNIFTMIKQGDADEKMTLDQLRKVMWEYYSERQTIQHWSCCGLFAMHAVWTFTIKSEAKHKYGNKPYLVILQNLTDATDYLLEDLPAMPWFDGVPWKWDDVDPVETAHETINCWAENIVVSGNAAASAYNTLAGSYFHADETAPSKNIELPYGVLVTPSGTYHKGNRTIRSRDLHKVSLGWRIRSNVLPLTSMGPGLAEALGEGSLPANMPKFLSMAAGVDLGFGSSSYPCKPHSGMSEGYKGHNPDGCVKCDERRYDVDAIVSKLRELF